MDRVTVTAEAWEAALRIAAVFNAITAQEKSDVDAIRRAKTWPVAK